MITVSRVVMLFGVILILLSGFGVGFPYVQVFELGVGVCFASFLVP
jgi:hypothetical protein